MRIASATAFLLSSAAALTVFAGTTGSWERDPGCVFPMSNDIADRVDRWHADMRSRDADAIAANYSPDAILMGIGEQSIRLGRREIAAHYTAVLEDKIAFSTLSRVIEASCSAAIVSGLQQVKRGEGSDAARAEVAYKMMYAYGDGAWMLIHHHLEPLSDFNREVAALPETGGARITTATLPERRAAPTAAPMVFVPSALPQVLSSVRPETPAAVKGMTLSPLDSSTGTSPAIAAPVVPTAVQITVPSPKIDIGTFPTIVAPITTPVTPSAPSAVIVPRLGIDIGAFPALPAAVPTAPAGAETAPERPVAMSPGSPARSDKATDKAAQPTPRAPAVAAVTQREAPAARPTPRMAVEQAVPVAKPKPVRVQAKVQEERSAPAPSQPALKPTPTTKPTSIWQSYRPVQRWDDRLPIFETN